MKIRTAFPIVLLAAASTLFAATAQAGINWNGPTLNGAVLNGPVLQGPVLQGPVLQGIALHGAVATDRTPASFVAVTLPGGETIPLR
jgi:uncharacterized protein YjbI with pentapeptide repeats